jgi:hypothetical protein
MGGREREKRYRKRFVKENKMEIVRREREGERGREREREGERGREREREGERGRERER